MAKARGKNYLKSKKTVTSKENLTFDKALELSKKASYAKFDESLELHFNLSIDPKDSDQRIRFTTTLPNGIGKSVKVLVISKENVEDVAKIVSGKLKPGKDFDTVIATPDVMKDIAKAARILGPKGMMPSPKNGTITADTKKAVEEFSKGQIEVKNQQGYPVLHQLVGSLKMDDAKLGENIKFLISEIKKNRPAKVKGKFIKKAVICSSMGPSITLDLDTL